MKLKIVSPRKGQEEYWNSLKNNTITFCTGRAGTGKSFLALYQAITALEDKSSGIQRVCIIRPYMASNTGERVGYLPGGLDDKVLPYVQCIRDNLRDMVKPDKIDDFISKLEFSILSMCRGRSFNNTFIIVEEAQNVPIDGDSMLMLLTRLGKGSRIVVQGDLDQMDIDSQNSALVEAINVVDGMEEVGIVEMNDLQTIQRSHLVGKIITRYEEARRNGAA
jgi:phosphate starvation-inducible PhoH-like protein